jgi:hypothetical protein
MADLDGVPDDPTISEDTRVFRRVSPSLVIEDGGARRPGSNAFADNPDPLGVDAMSVFVESRLAELELMPAAVLGNYPGYWLVALFVRDIRTFGLGIIWSPDESLGALGQAHADVYGPKTQSVRRKLRTVAEIVIVGS